jgi:hypothetical protein
MRTLEECKKLVEDDPEGLGSSPGLLQQILNVDERLVKLEALASRAGNPPPAAPQQQQQQQQSPPTP